VDLREDLNVAEHATNQRAFRDCDVSEPFFRLYTLIVAMELAVKNKMTTFAHGHDFSMLIPQALPTLPSGLQSQLTVLDASLRVLICTFHGSRAPVNPAFYPGIRYLRHEKDGFTGDSSDASILQALRDAEQLANELKRAGIAI
jgi:hypothetical protein